MTRSQVRTAFVCGATQGALAALKSESDIQTAADVYMTNLPKRQRRWLSRPKHKTKVK